MMESKQFLGGDLKFESSTPLDESVFPEGDYSYTTIYEFGSVLGSDTNFQLASIKSVSSPYPLVGEIEIQDISSIFQLEVELFPCLVEMRFLGVRVDQEQAFNEKKILVEHEKKLLRAIRHETDIDVQIWAARSIAKIFDKLKLPYDRTL